jgi:hypothetical protein
MNMDIGIVNRALLSIGQYILTDEDIRRKNANYQEIRQYYMQSFLEALSELEWVGGRKRIKLMLSRRPLLKNKEYAFVYDLPFDCARPIELQDNAPFIIEDRLLYANISKAELLYVSNGKILRPVAVISCGRPGDVHDMEYISAGGPEDESDLVIRGGVPQDFLWFGPQPGPNAHYPNGHVPEGWDGVTPLPLPPDPESTEDYPDYLALQYEPKFYEYIEKTLAARLAMKVSAQPNLHVQLMQEAMLIKQEAIYTSRSHRASKVEPNAWWTEGMGR